MSGYRFVNPAPQFRDNSDDTAVGGLLYFYAAGTLTLQDTFSDSDLTIPNANPVELDAYGRPKVDVFLDPALQYRCIYKDSDEVVVWDKNILNGGDIASAIEAHNEDPNAHYAASETQRGFIELANPTEAVEGEDAQRGMTPATVRAVLDANSGMTMTGVINEFKGANIASAATVNLDAATGNLVDITGTTTITAITLAEGRERIIRFRDSLTLTHSSSLLLPGKKNIQTAENDFALVRGYSGATALAFYTRASGYLPIGTGPVTIATGNISTSGDTSIAIPAGSWKNLKLRINDLKAATAYTPYLRFNNDSTAVYSYTQWSVTTTGENNFSRASESGISIAIRDALLAASTGVQYPFDAEIDLPDITRADFKQGFIRSCVSNATAFTSVTGSLVWASSSAMSSIQLLLRGTAGTSPTGSTIDASAGTYTLIGELGTI